MRKLIFIVTTAVLLSSCSAEPDFSLSESATPRIERDSKALLEYDENFHQMAFDNAKNEFRITTDNMTDFLVVDLDALPTTAPSSVKALSIQWSSAGGIISKTNLKMDVIKIEGNKIWLWNASEKIGLCLSTLN